MSFVQVQGEAGRVGVSGRKYTLTPGTAVAINPWEPHAFMPGSGRGGGLFLLLYIDPSWFLDIRSDGQPALRFGATEIEVTDSIWRIGRNGCRPPARLPSNGWVGWKVISVGKRLLRPVMAR